MRPITLIMSAFGPFADKITVDFDSLGTQGMYLITGDTGAGKTTIFDAVTYALYGEASGDNRRADMLRSKYAKSDTKTFVELEFECRSKRYKVTRNPAYDRPKDRGEGLTRELAKAELVSGEKIISTRIAEVNRSIEEIIGIDRNQFTQIAMIAQGDFLKLLLASTEERSTIFRKIFDTSKYERLQREINSDYRKIYGECEDLRKSIQQYVEGTSCREGDADWEKLQQAKEGRMLTEDVIVLLDNIICRDAEEKAAADIRLERIEKGSMEVAARISQGKDIQNNQQELAHNQQEKQKVEQELLSAKKKLELAKGQEPVIGQLENHILILRDKIPQYDELSVLQKALKETDDSLTKLERQHTSLSRIQQELAKALEGDKEEQEALASAAVDLERIRYKLQENEKKLQECEELQKDHKNYVNLEKKYSKAAEEYQLERDRADAMYALYRKKERAFMDEQAGILAGKLEEGKPCPVCGSIDHPHPARPSIQAPDQNELEKLKEETEETEKQLKRKNEKAVLLKGQKEEKEESIRQQAENILSTGDLANIAAVLEMHMGEYRDMLKGLREHEKNTEEKVKRLKALQVSIPKKEKQFQDNQQQEGRRKEEIAAKKEQVNQLKRQIQKLAQKLEYQNKEEVQAKILELEKQRDVLKGDIDKADKRVQHLISAMAALDGAINSLEKRLVNVQNINLEEEYARQSRFDEQKLESTAKRDTLHARMESNRRALEHIKQRNQKLAEKEERCRWLKALEDTANGRYQKIKLETYVQMAYFDRILEQANRRFEIMSGGQYTLIRQKEVLDGRMKNAGLDLDVIDHYNGSVRSVRTLSGGEAFKASLSLALGLSDEIQAYAGGVRLDTMFVDEGFGSLDEDSLQQALNALAELSEGNRLVGIISHVAELKNRIDRQIVVTKDHQGRSSIKL